MATAIIYHKPRENRFVEFCDFCGSTADEAQLLIKITNGHHICDVCVDVCLDVISQRKSRRGE